MEKYFLIIIYYQIQRGWRNLGFKNCELTKDLLLMPTATDQEHLTHKLMNKLRKLSDITLSKNVD